MQNIDPKSSAVENQETDVVDKSSSQDVAQTVTDERPNESVEVSKEQNAEEKSEALEVKDKELSEKEKKEKEAALDDNMEKQVGATATKLKSKMVEKEIKRVEDVKARAEKKLNRGATGFNKQVIRNEFYRDNFRTLVKIALVNSIVMVAIIIGMLIYMFRTIPDNRFFATTVDGRIMQLIPLDKPGMTRPELYSWVVQAVSDTLTFGYHDYQRRLQDSTHYFTRAGWESFTSMLQQMNLIDTIGRAKLLVKSYPRSAPELQQEGEFNGRYRWVMDVDFTISMTGKGSGGGTRALRLRLTVERVPVLENIKGVAIKRWEVISSR